MKTLTPDTGHYFPTHIKKIDEFKEIAGAYDKSLAVAWKNLGTIYDNNYFDGMDESECEYWEKRFGITVNPLDTLEDRRNRIRGYSVSDLPYTEKKMREMLTAMCGTDGFTFVPDPSVKKLKVGVKLTGQQLVTNITEILRKMIPADMELEVALLYNQHKRFRILTHAQLPKYTHEELRTSMDFQWHEDINAKVARSRHSDLAAMKHVNIMLGGKEIEDLGLRT